jgi:capsular polysaccharide biosynthesis protein
MMSLSVAAISDHCSPGGPVEFNELEPAVTRKGQLPDFLVGDLTDDLLAAVTAPSGLHAVGIFICNDAKLIAPFFIVQDTKLYLCPEVNIHSAYIQEAWKERDGFRSIRNVRKISGECAMVFGPGHKMFGHWMADLLPKLYLLHKAGYDFDQLSVALPSDAPDFARQLLQMAGIPRDRIVEFDAQTEALHCERLLVPTMLHNGSIFARIAKEVAPWLRRQVETHYGPLTERISAARVLISRGHAFRFNRVLTNRAKIEAIAAAAGCELICPEELPLIDQFAIFANAQEIVGEYGAALHSAIFAPAGAKLCIVRGNGYHPGFIQSGIAEACEHCLSYIIGTNTGQNWDFRVDPKDFAVGLENAFGEPGLASGLLALPRAGSETADKAEANDAEPEPTSEAGIAFLQSVGLEPHAGPMMDYVGLLGLIKRLLQPATYIEVGMGGGATLLSDPIPEFVVGIDPQAHLEGPAVELAMRCRNLLILRATSDEAFAQMASEQTLGERKADLAFVDGLHHCEVVLRDIANCARFSREGALILVHDVFPGNEAEASRTLIPGSWMGDVYKVVPIIWRHLSGVPTLLIREVPPSGMFAIRVTGEIYDTIFRNYDALVAAMEAQEFAPTMREMRERSVTATSGEFGAFVERALAR